MRATGASGMAAQVRGVRRAGPAAGQLILEPAVSPNPGVLAGKVTRGPAPAAAQPEG